MSDDGILRDYLDAMLAEESSVSAPLPEDLSKAEVTDRLERAERCHALLTQVWGETGPTDRPTDKPPSPRPTNWSAEEQPPQRDTSTADAPTVFSSEATNDGDDFQLQNLGRFIIRRLLGRGGMGSVFLAYDPGIDREVALKIPHAGLLIDPGAKRRFLREARVAGRLQHANLISIHEAGEVGPICYIASSYCSGPTLAQWLASRKEPIDHRLAARVVAALADALQHVHQRGVLHRDLKPGNILLDPIDPESDSSQSIEGFSYTPKVADFGLAELEGDASLTSARGPLGTAKYMSPEQASGSELVGLSTDIYALGVILYEMLCGSAPFERATMSATLVAVHNEQPAPVRKRRADLPQDLESICMKCLCKDPSDRYHSAAELRDDLNRMLDGLTTLARPLSSRERLVRWARRAPALAALVLVSFLSVAGLIVGLSLYSRAARRHTKQVEAALAVAEDGRRQAADSLRAETQAKLAAAKEHRIAEEQRRRAVASELRARQLGYRSDMQRAFDYLQAKRLHEAAEVLQRQTPEPDKLDLRGVEWRVLSAEVEARLLTLGGHQGLAAECVSFPDGLRLASVGEDGVIRIWNLASATLERTIEPHVGQLHALAISPDGKTIAVGGKPALKTLDRARVYLLDAETGEQQLVLHRHSTTIETITFSPDGKLVASGGRYGSIQVADVADGKTQHVFAGRRRNRSVAFSPDSRRLATIHQSLKTGGKRSVRIWDMESGDLVKEFPSDKNVHFIRWAPNGRELALARFHDPFVSILNVDTSAIEKQYYASAPYPREIACLTFNADGTQLVAGDVEGRIHIWDYPASPEAKGRLWPQRSLSVHSAYLSSVHVMKDRLAVACDDGCVKLIRPLGRAFRSAKTSGTAITIDDSGKVYTGNERGEVWAGYEKKKRLLLGRVAESSIAELAVSADQNTLIALDVMGRVSVLEAKSGRLLWTPPVEPLPAVNEGADSCIAISADGQLLAVSRSDDMLRVFDVSNKSALITHPKANVRALAVSADGQRIAYGGIFEQVQVMDVAGGGVRNAFLAGGRTLALKFSPDGSHLVSANWDGSVRIHNFENGETLVKQGHRAAVDCIAFSRDGRTLISRDGSSNHPPLRFWDLKSGELYGALEHPVAEVEANIFASERGLIIAEGDTGEVKLDHWPR